MMLAMQGALNRTTKRLLDELKRIIQTEIYDSYDPVSYDRTGQFLDSWETMPAVIVGKFAESEIWQEYSEMIWDENNDGLYSHGNAYRSAAENELNRIFNDGMKSDVTMVPNARKWDTHFWDKFEIYINANLYNIFQEELGGLINATIIRG